MKKKKFQNNSGITVCDSIVMSVKTKHINLRRIESVFIALTGYISAIMVFLCMFDFKYSHTALFASAVVFSAIYIFLSLMGKNALWIIIITICAGGAAVWKVMDSVSMGYKFVYNIAYRASYHTEIDYYKFLDGELEKDCVTTFFILCAWLLSLVIYIFTIYHPHPLPPLIAVFPILEIGMYNGLEVNIFWGMLAIGFLIASFGMSTIDMGEYSGGNGGFVRKENLFFPKRQMRLKVTEKCGVYIIILVMLSAGLAAGGIKLTGYKRSEELNQKRIDIRDAVNSFSIENLADSISNLTAAFGFTFKMESHKLGNIASMKYKDRTDMTVTLDQKFDGAIYLKEYTGSVYRNNEWLTLPESDYNDPVFTDFKTYNIYPQDFPFRFNKIIDVNDKEYTININSSLKGNRSFAPYGSDNIGGIIYNHDSDVSTKDRNEKEFSYKFSRVDAEIVAQMLDRPVRNVYALDNIADEEWKNTITEYCQNKGIIDYDDYLSIDSELPFNMELMYNNPPLIMTELIQEEYEQFVYDNYLQIPDNTNMDEIRDAFADILDVSDQAVIAVDKLQILYALRAQVAEMAEYSLQPGKTPKNRDFVNYFLLENNKGYCTHYATSGVILARMAGIPARYATGYVLVGDDFCGDTQNADGSYTIDVKDNRSHAWIEVYLSGYGWVPFEFTAGYTSQSIDTTPATEAEVPTENTETTTAPEAQPDPSTTHDNSAAATTSANGDAAVNTTVPITSHGVGMSEGFSGSGGGAKLPQSVKYVIYSVLTVFAAVMLIIIRHRLTMCIRKKRFISGSTAERAGHMYAYAEKLLDFVKIKQGEMQYSDFAEYAEVRCCGVYFSHGSFKEFMDISLRAVFSDTAPENEEMMKCKDFVDNMSKGIYEKASFIGKIYLKFIVCLI